MTQEYTFSHVTDLATLSDDDIDACCEALPKMIRQLKELQDGLGILEEAGLVEPVPLSRMVPLITWKNDGKDSLTLNLKSNGESLGTVTIE
ncbi:MAG: hypothetical protein AB7D26_12835 [Marinobacterium sp.]